MTPRDALTRWRLLLGAEAEQGLGCGLGGQEAQQDAALDFREKAPMSASKSMPAPALSAPPAKVYPNNLIASP